MYSFEPIIWPTTPVHPINTTLAQGVMTMSTDATAISKCQDAVVSLLDISIADCGRSVRNGVRKLKQRKMTKQVELINRVIEAQRNQSA